MKKTFAASVIVALAAAGVSSPAAAESARSQQAKGIAAIPTCSKKLGTLAIGEPQNNWWSQLSLESPEALLKVFVLKSGCFGLVDRSRGLAARSVEQALAEAGELQQASNVGKGQVKAADYVLVPDIVLGNSKAGGGGIGGLGMLGSLGGRKLGLLGGLVGGVNFKKKEANVTLTLVNTRTTEQERLTEGYAKKNDIGFGGGGLFEGFGAGAYGYGNTELGQVIGLAYLDAYSKLVKELGGLSPASAPAALPAAK
jgi:curli biogenesis system outer membrane secretion channel CsgG